MKTKIKQLTIVQLLLLFSFFNVHSQQNKKKANVYKVKVKLMDLTVEKGFLYEANDESLKIISNPSLQEESSIKIIKAQNIYAVYLGRRGKVLKGAGIGFASGAILGAVLNEAGGDSWIGTGQVALTAGVIGMSFGVLKGAGKKKYEVFGSAEAFRNINLNEYAIIKN